MPRTLNLDEAAAMLHTSADTVGLAIQNQGLPAVKVGRAWVLIDDDVIAWLRTRYGKKPDDTTQSQQQDETTCASINAARQGSGGSISEKKAASAIDAALAPRTGARRRSTPPTLRKISGAPAGSGKRPV